MSICFARFELVSFSISILHPSLSTFKATGNTSLPLSISSSRLIRNNPLEATWLAAYVSASVDDSETAVCFLQILSIKHPFKNMQPPVVDLRSSWSLAQSLLRCPHLRGAVFWHFWATAWRVRFYYVDSNRFFGLYSILLNFMNVGKGVRIQCVWRGCTKP